ncbi:MAG: acetyltransferase, ribosomal protein N-acetylase [Oscillospiraceae bacterium]|nr:acetyltransferase, ribosomal protein N-acetylase [Oscillospiraceae bacterium]
MLKDMRLETERLIIQPYREEDLVECFQLMQDQDLFEFLDMSVMSFEDYGELFHWIISCYNIDFDGDFKYSFSINLKESGKHIGWVGIGGIEYDHSIKEIYWLIGKKYWNNGYATEAAAALLTYGFDVIGLNNITAVCKPGNIASQKVMEHVGLKYQGIVQGLPKEYDWYNGELKYKLSKDEYKSII